MLNDLNTVVSDKTLRKYIYHDLLVIDEMGHDRLELEVTKEAHLLFKVNDERYNKNKPIILLPMSGKRTVPNTLAIPSRPALSWTVYSTTQ